MKITILITLLVLLGSCTGANVQKEDMTNNQTNNSVTTTTNVNNTEDVITEEEIDKELNAIFDSIK